MTKTIAGDLLTDLEDWLQKVESTNDGQYNNPVKSAQNSLVVNALFNQMAFIVTIIGTDAEGWKEVEEFTKQQSGRYRSQAVHGCLNLLSKIADQFIPTE